MSSTTRPLRWYHKLFYKWSRHGDVNQALYSMFQKGIQIGMKRVTHHQDCEYHGIALKRLPGGCMLVCPICESLQRATGPLTEPVLQQPATHVVTGRLKVYRVPGERLLHTYNHRIKGRV